MPIAKSANELKSIVQNTQPPPISRPECCPNQLSEGDVDSVVHREEVVLAGEHKCSAVQRLGFQHGNGKGKNMPQY